MSRSLSEEQRSSEAGRQGKATLSPSQQKDVDEMADNFGRTLGSNDPEEESDEDFFRGW